jgi:hypothetical protein
MQPITLILIAIAVGGILLFATQSTPTFAQGFSGVTDPGLSVPYDTSDPPKSVSLNDLGCGGSGDDNTRAITTPQYFPKRFSFNRVPNACNASNECPTNYACVNGKCVQRQHRQVLNSACGWMYPAASPLPETKACDCNKVYALFE